MNKLFIARIHFALITIALSICLFQGCKCKRTDPSKIIIEKDIAVEKVTIQAERFEKDLFNINLDSIESSVEKLKAHYGEFFDLFNHKIVSLGSPDNKRYPEALKGFITDYYMNLNYRKVMEVYPNITDLNTELSNAFSIYRGYFPQRKIPRIITCISGWNYSVVTTDSIIAIALDKYLGRDCEYYEKLRFDKYLRYTMQREYILPDCMRDWGYAEFAFNDSANTVLNNMLYEAKILYFVKKMMPQAHDSIVFGYTPAQLKWCKNNSKEMWTYLVEHKILYASQYLMIRKLVYPAPFTSFFTRESPGRAVVWLGYQIIMAYMEANPNVSLEQLMTDSDYQKILQKSKFKP